jgi:hypothetical protein
MNAPSMVFHLHSTLAYKKSISTIGASKIDSNRGLGLLALAFALSVVVSADAVQPGQQSQNQQSSPVNKTKQPAQTSSDSEIYEFSCLATGRQIRRINVDSRTRRPGN